MKLSHIHNRSLAILIARVILGLIFFMAGQWKLFSLGPLGHARRWFVGPYAETFLPMWSLWATGTVVPFVEFVAGALLLVGLWTRPALAALGGVLIIVTFGHLLADGRRVLEAESLRLVELVALARDAQLIPPGV